MNKKEKNCPDSWVFEQDISKGIKNNYNRTMNKVRNITMLLSILLALIGYYYFFNRYGSAIKALKIIIFLYIASILATYLVIWIVKNRIVKKYWTMIIIPIIALVAVIVVINIYPSENISLQRSDILSFCGEYLTFLGTFCLGYFIYIQDRTKMIEEKRTRVRMLIALMENANIELLKLSRLARNNKYTQIPENRGLVEPISYNSDWMLYYYEYEALEGENSELRHTLNSFFDNVIHVNTAIKNGRIELANKINVGHIESNCYSTSKYNELEALACLQDACCDYHLLNTKSWIERKETVDLINELCKKYYFIIENYVYVWLLKHNVETTTEQDNIDREIVDWLLTSPELKKKIKYPSDKRIISRVVFDCSLKFDKESEKIGYVWGEYFLK